MNGFSRTCAAGTMFTGVDVKAAASFASIVFSDERLYEANLLGFRDDFDRVSLLLASRARHPWILVAHRPLRLY